MPYVMVLPFAGLVVAAAAVGAGRGGDLPVLTLAGAALLHSHVAQPLFVVPLVGLAWAALAWAHGGRPWRAFPRAHAAAMAVVVLAALPVALDALRGPGSNLALILAHRRTHLGEGHPWLDALGYYLRLASFAPFANREEAFRGGATWATLGGYAARHALILTVWTLAAGLLAAGAWGSRFGRCLLVSVTLAAGLAVWWATEQDGALLYFNSWFVYGLLLVVGLGAAAAAVRGLTATFPRLARTPWPALVLAVLVAGLFAVKAERFRARSGDDVPSRNIVASVDAALAGDADGRSRPRYLAFPHDAWEDAVAIALELERRGEPWQVHPGWALIFGRGHALAGVPPAALRSPAGGGLRVWHVTPRSPDPDAPPARHPLFQGGDLRTEPPVVNPAADGGVGTTLAFCGPRPNAADYLLGGWSGPTPGDSYTWSERTEGLMAFHAVPVPTDQTVEVTIDAFPAITPGKVDAQRLELSLGDQSLGAETVRTDEPTRVNIPAAVWNAHPEAVLVWRFPDATSPARLGRGDDRRELAFGFRKVTFALAR